MAKKRAANVKRDTLETAVEVALNLDGSGKNKLETGLPFFEHMLEQIARHGHFDINIKAKGDLEVDAHHTVEDIGIVLGQALRKALDTKAGVQRYGHAYIPLDEALSRVVVDLSGRPCLIWQVSFTRAVVGGFDVDLFREFFQAMVNHGQFTLHVDNLRGDNSHHQAETIFKAFGRALRMAVAIDKDTKKQVPSTKGTLHA